MAAGIAVLLVIVLVFIGRRIVTDAPSIVAGTTPDDDFAERYVADPWTSYLHIGFGLFYLLGALLQLSRRFRVHHYTVHRRLGRALLGAGLLTGLSAVVIGVRHPWGGVIESSATVVFGLWFLVCLVLAFRSIRRGEVARHRRWMIRAFAIGIGIGTIRVWVGIFTPFVLAIRGPEPSLPEPVTFGIAFWLAFALHAGIAEWWLRHRPDLRS